MAVNVKGLMSPRVFLVHGEQLWLDALPDAYPKLISVMAEIKAWSSESIVLTSESDAAFDKLIKSTITASAGLTQLTTVFASSLQWVQRTLYFVVLLITSTQYTTQQLQTVNTQVTTKVCGQGWCCTVNKNNSDKIWSVYFQPFLR